MGTCVLVIRTKVKGVTLNVAQSTAFGVPGTTGAFVLSAAAGESKIETGSKALCYVGAVIAWALQLIVVNVMLSVVPLIASGTNGRNGQFVLDHAGQEHNQAREIYQFRRFAMASNARGLSTVRAIATSSVVP